MKLHKAEIVMIILAFLFMVAVAVQAYLPEKHPETVLVSVETSAGPEALLTGGDGEVADKEIGLININTADLETLCLLPGIGEVIAGRIIQYREANGSFAKIDDITKVSGIGEKTFDSIKNLIICKEDGK